MSKPVDLEIYKEAKEFLEIAKKVKPVMECVTELYESFYEWNQSNRHLIEIVGSTPHKPKRNSPKV